MADKQDGYKLRGIWKSKYEQSVGAWTSSIHRDAAQLKRVVEDVGFDRALDIMNYYFEISTKPDFMKYLYDYDRLGEAMDERDEDMRRSKLRREYTRRRMESLDEG